MQVYRNIKGDSGVTHFSIGGNYIAVKFKDKETIYVYSTDRIGKQHIDRMKDLALLGKGLSTYISQHPEVKNNYTTF
jgi:hypothetical protein